MNSEPHDSSDFLVDTLRWKMENYNNCAYHLCSSSKLPALSHVYRMAAESIYEGDHRGTLHIDQFPFELLEMILTKATGRLYVTISRTRQPAEVYAFVTLLAVSLLWRKTLIQRKYNKRLIKRYFRRESHPYKSIQLKRAAGPHVEGNSDVVGVAELNSKLYVACGRSSTIQVFQSDPPFGQLKNIKVEGMESASDIVACRKTGKLYIADSAKCVIWRLSPVASELFGACVGIEWRPFSLSVNFGRLLITPYLGDSVSLLGEDGTQLHRIELPSYMLARRAVETTRNTYIISHRNRFFDDAKHNGVTELDSSGNVIRTFNNHRNSDLLNWFYYLLSDNDHVIIADLLRERIILLKSDLRLKRNLVNCLGCRGKKPLRLCLTSAQLLLVC